MIHSSVLEARAMEVRNASMVVEKNPTGNVYRVFLPRYGERAKRARVERCRS